jgi:hypothetical protein
MAIDKRIAEVISANSTEFCAQCYRLHQSPPLGALVKTGKDTDRHILGIVYSVETHGLDIGRRVTIRGDNLEREDNIFSENPHLEKLLVTDIKAIVVGYREADKLSVFLPPQPPPLHSFVYVCESAEVLDFSRSFNFLTILSQAMLQVSPDEIIAASLRYISGFHVHREDFLVKAGKELVWILGGDVRRLNSILKRLDFAE